MTNCRRTQNPLLAGLIVLGVALCAGVVADGQELEWIPTIRTHAWSRFGRGAWKEVRVTSESFDETGKAFNRSSKVTHTEVKKVGLRSFSLCVSTRVEAAGREFPSEPQEITQAVAPDIKSSQVVGNEKLTINDQQYETQVIRFVTTNGTKRETSTLYYCATTRPQMLKRVTTSVDTANPEVTSETTVTVTELDKTIDLLTELKCTWTVQTVFKNKTKTVVSREVNCQQVPGELVSRVTEERDSKGRLVQRSQLETTGYGIGRLRRIFRRRR